jgi:hypothetical protein
MRILTMTATRPSGRWVMGGWGAAHAASTGVERALRRGASICRTALHYTALHFIQFGNRGPCWVVVLAVQLFVAQLAVQSVGILLWLGRRGISMPLLSQEII